MKFNESQAALATALFEFSEEAERQRIAMDPIVVREESDLEQVPSRPGIYWIETTMALDALRNTVVDKKRERKNLPKGCASLIEQIAGRSYVVYSGTHRNIRRRLREHLFDVGGKGTKRLGCNLAKPEFSQAVWTIKFLQIDDDQVRHAAENKWRLRYGWPQMCFV